MSILLLIYDIEEMYVLWFLKHAWAFIRRNTVFVEISMLILAV